jgi:hypothetical protein
VEPDVSGEVSLSIGDPSSRKMVRHIDSKEESVTALPLRNWILTPPSGTSRA